MQHSALIAEAFNTPHLFEPTYAANLFTIATQRIGVGFEFNPAGIDAPGAVTDHTSYMRGSNDEPRRQGARWFRLDGAEHVAVIPIVGSMIHRGNAFASMQRTYQSIEADYADLMDDSKTRAIIIDMDSPGGTVAGGFSALEFMRENKRKPVYVNVNERMLSGGLLLGSIADETAMLKTAHAGSLGVIVTHLNVAERMQRDGVKATMIFSGTHKADGHPYGDLPKEVQSRIQSDLDNTRQMFAEAVALGKPGISVDQLLSHEAQIFRGVDAVNAGLANVVTTSPTAYYRDIASRHRSGGGKSQSTATGATPEQTTTDDEPAATNQGQTETMKLTEAEREAMKAEIREEMEAEQRTADALEADRQIKAKAAAEKRQTEIVGHELAELRPKLAASLAAMSDDVMPVKTAIATLAAAQPEVTAPGGSVQVHGSIASAMQHPDNLPGISTTGAEGQAAGMAGGGGAGAGMVSDEHNMHAAAEMIAAETGMPIEHARAELIEAAQLDMQNPPKFGGAMKDSNPEGMHKRFTDGSFMAGVGAAVAGEILSNDHL